MNIFWLNQSFKTWGFYSKDLFAFSTIHSSYTSLKHEIKQLAVSFNIDSGTKHKTLGETNESYLRKEQGYSF